MSVLISDIRVYGSASMPEADGATVGGAIDFTKRIEFGVPSGSPLFAAIQYDVVSSAAGDTTKQITFNGRDSSGTIRTETLTMNGTTKVTSANSYERLLSALISGATSAFGLTSPGGTAPAGDVALIAHSGLVTGTMASASTTGTASNPPTATLATVSGVLVGMVLHTLTNTGANQIRRILAINPNGLGANVVAVDRNFGVALDNTTTYEVGPGMHFELTGSNGGANLSGTATQVLGITRMFATAAAQATGGSAASYYEKVFVNNNNQSTALSAANVEVLSNSPALPTGAILDLGVTSGLNDTATTTNRQTAPSTIVFTPSQPSPINVPTGSMPASLSAGSATGAVAVWLRLSLQPGTVAYEGSPGATLQTQGSTT
jgi:hypothetical protein